MELYLEDSEFRPGHPLHWDLPSQLQSPSTSGPSRGRRRRMPPGRFGQLITIGRGRGESSERNAPYAGEIEAFCDSPQEIIGVIQRFSNITALYINSHATPDRRSRQAEVAGRRGIQLGGTTIYEDHLPMFRGVRSCFERFWYITEPWLVEAMVLAQSPPAILPDRRISFDRIGSITPRIVLCGCAIAQDRSFCQRLANEAEVYVFGATIDQYSGQRQRVIPPWTMHGPILVFIPISNFGLGAGASGTSAIHNLSPFNRRLGQQRMATGSGRSTGRRSGTIGLA